MLFTPISTSILLTVLSLRVLGAPAPPSYGAIAAAPVPNTYTYADASENSNTDYQNNHQAYPQDAPSAYPTPEYTTSTYPEQPNDYDTSYNKRGIRSKNTGSRESLHNGFAPLWIKRHVASSSNAGSTAGLSEHLATDPRVKAGLKNDAPAVSTSPGVNAYYGLKKRQLQNSGLVTSVLGTGAGGENKD